MKTPLPFFLLFALVLLVTPLAAQPLGLSPSKVPAPARQAFAQNHPGAKVLWQRGEKGRFEAFFFEEGIRHTDVYAADGTLVIKKTNILESQTPAQVAEAVRKAYPNAEWVEVNTMMTAAGKPLVEVNLVHLGKEYRLNYDYNGILKSGGQREAATAVAGN